MFCTSWELILGFSTTVFSKMRQRLFTSVFSPQSPTCGAYGASGVAGSLKTNGNSLETGFRVMRTMALDSIGFLWEIANPPIGF